MHGETNCLVCILIKERIFFSILVVLPFQLAYKPGGATNFYEGLMIRVTTAEDGASFIFDSTDATMDDYSSGIADSDEYFYIVDYVMTHINNNSAGVTVYWERYKTLYRPNSFIIVPTNTSKTLQSAEWGSTVDGVYTLVSATADNQLIYDVAALDAKSLETQWVEGALTNIRLYLDEMGDLTRLS